MTPEAQALVELAARVEQATGADRGLDGDIALAVRHNFLCEQRYKGEPHRFGRREADGSETYPGNGRWILVKCYTYSVEDAMALLPEQDRWFTRLATEDRHSHSWRWELRGGYGWDASARAATTALALCAAALRARALSLIEATHGEGGVE